jgi:SP family sugar:H+ symporter-like MFS transporter
MQDFIYNFGDAPGQTPPFTWWRAGLIVALFSIGTLLGALMAGPIANHPKIGRKYSILLCCVFYILGNVAQMTAQYQMWYLIMIGYVYQLNVIDMG